MESPKCLPSALQRLENTTRRFFGSSDLARAKSMVCMKAVPFRNLRSMRPRATTLPGGTIRPAPRLAVKIHRRDQDFDNGRDCYQTLRKHLAHPVEPPDKAERDDVSHVCSSRGHLERGGE